MLSITINLQKSSFVDKYSVFNKLTIKIVDCFLNKNIIYKIFLYLFKHSYHSVFIAVLVIKTNGI